MNYFYSEECEPDLLPPKSGSGEIINGWSFNRYAKKVWKSCSSSYSHATRRWDKPDAQNPIKQYSSKELAYKGLRNALEKQLIADLYLLEKEERADKND